jgi:hypothetical protein
VTLAGAACDALEDMKMNGTDDKLMDGYGATKIEAWDQDEGGLKVTHARH